MERTTVDLSPKKWTIFGAIWPLSTRSQTCPGNTAELRRQTCERMLAGESVKDLVAELGIADRTLYEWRRQTLIDGDRRPGAKSYEADPVLQARRRIKELEAERHHDQPGRSRFVNR